VLVQDVPKFGFDPYARVMGASMPARAALGRLLSHGANSESFDTADVVPDPSRAIVAAVAERRGAMLFDPTQALCTGPRCRFATADALYYSDFQHLTAAGAKAAVKGFMPPHLP